MERTDALSTSTISSKSGCLHVCTTRTDALSTSTIGSRSGCLHVSTTRTDALSTSTTSSKFFKFVNLIIKCDLFEKDEAQLKRPPQFQELFDETHKKKGTYYYISEKAREVADSYGRGMDERYGDDSQHPELDPDVWVAASGAPKKGHVYGFRHSLGTTRVISSCSNFISHATSPFTTHEASGGSSSATPTMTPTQFRESVNET
ncbi:hypothetical protein Taro_024965, partial [Colocasia esculenta]|nr:hypothetical protein [Colocasia esculenta]